MSVNIPAGFGEAAIVCTHTDGTAPYVTTIGVGIADAEGDYVAAADAVYRAYAESFMPLMPSVYVFERVTLTVPIGGGGTGSVDSSRGPENGSRSGAFTAVAMAPVMSKRTAQLGRSGRGRMFIPGVLLDSEVESDGTITTSARGDLDDAGAAFLANLVEGPVGLPMVNPVLLHSDPDLDPTSINALVCGSKVGWIRKRLR